MAAKDLVLYLDLNPGYVSFFAHNVLIQELVLTWLQLFSFLPFGSGRGNL